VETRLTGKGVLVTGGAGGIGSAIVRAFAAEGAHVAVHYNTSAQAAAALAGEVGGVAIRADLCDEAAADRLIPDAVAALGRLDVCVANAGRWPLHDQSIWEMSLERWNDTLATNLTATFLTARGFLRHAKETGAGSLVMVASTAGSFGEAGHADYAAAKGAILSGLLMSVKNEAARIGPGVRVNVVSPGWTATPGLLARGLSDEHFARATATMALKKLGKPEDVARQVVILGSDELSGHLTGTVISVAGGMEGRIIDGP
jgi:3-oxoacyl-[acyl-carrier protein] reductase